MDINKTELDFQILQNGAISMYHNQSVLNKDLIELENLGYHIQDFNVRNWTVKKFHQEVSAQLGFPDYYGENLSAYNDCLGDLNPTSRKGLVFVFRYFDVFLTANKLFCGEMLDIMANQSWQWLLTNQRLITLIQSNNPDLQIDKIGGFHPTWNSQEWIDDQRRTT